MENVFKNNNTFRIVYNFLGRWKSLRCLNTHCKKNIEKYILVLNISENSPQIIIQNLINNLSYIEVLVLFKNKQTDDSLVHKIYSTCKKLKYLYLDYCNNISSDIFQNKPHNLCISVYGCWKTQKPDKNKSPEDVVEIQMWCLQYLHEGGYDKMLEFVSLYYQYVFINTLQRVEMESIMNSSSFSILTCFQHFNNAIVQVENFDNTKCSKRFQWVLNRIDEIWYTTNIFCIK